MALKSKTYTHDFTKGDVEDSFSFSSHFNFIKRNWMIQKLFVLYVFTNKSRKYFLVQENEDLAWSAFFHFLDRF